MNDTIRKTGLLAALLSSTLLAQIASADVVLNRLFSDHMVIQRQTEAPIWGWADPGEAVTINASWGASATVTTADDGSWAAKIKTPKAGGPFEITVTGKNEIVVEDVLAGEVWFCSGQSNMDFAMAKFVNDAREPQYQPLVEYIREEVSNANDPWLRHIEVPHTTSLSEKKKNFEADWIEVKPGQTEAITATGYFFAKELRKHLKVPIGLVECSWGGTRIQPWISEAAYLADPELKAYLKTERARAEATIKEMTADGYVDSVYLEKLAKWEKSGKKGRKPNAKKNPADDMQEPATLHNGMVSAVIPFAIKGAIWYQGESNASYLTERYEKDYITLIESWRKEWGQGNFSFYSTQLAGYNAGDARNEGWASVGDQIRRGLKLPNTGVVALYDIGEAKDIHPHNKMDTGKRLALWALKKDYRIAVPVVSGPLYKNSKIKNGKIRLTFTEVGSGLMVGSKELMNATVSTDAPLQWFEISSDGKNWMKADAKIVSKNKIEVWSPEVPQPTEVRYAWTANPIGANLYNKEGLPAAVFSTVDN